ncbi:unnamed protein product [Diabrotica balteata]|uniref:EF-hand domain-containing protein n=1 Tax=Diabrotica balteata TaxID=107213 RepID=A0A9N9T776_DIABA|nr:unnamed protein product [Diabrotica balteata]
MSNKQPQATPSSGKKLSVRGGVFVIKGVTLFLAAAKTPKTSNQPSGSSGAKSRGRKKMSEKDVCKCSPKIMEAAKKDTLLHKNCLIKHPQEEDPDESVKDLVDIVMRKIDKDKDGKVSLEDFQNTVEEEPLLLEAFGKCLPSEESKMTFLTTLKA